MGRIRNIALFLSGFTGILLLLFMYKEAYPQSKQLPFQQQAPVPVDEKKLALQFFQAGDYEKAAELFGKLFAEQPTQYYYTYLLHSLVEMKEYKQAERIIREQRKSDDGNSPRYLVDLGYLAYRQGQGEKAYKLYDEALESLPADQRLIHELANAFVQKGESRYAEKTYLKGRELLGGAYGFNYELAATYQRLGNFTALFGEYLNLVEQNPAQLQQVQDRLQGILADDPENTRNELFREELLRRIQTNPDQQVYADLLWWYSVQQKDFELALIQARALDRRRQEQGGRILQLAQLASANEQYDVALDAYRYLTAKGKDYPYYAVSRIEYVNTRYRQVTSGMNPTDPGTLLDLEKEMEEVLVFAGEQPHSVDLIIHLAHLEAFYLDRADSAVTRLEKLLVIPGLDPKQKAACKLELADVLLFHEEEWEATLLYQQVYKEFKYDVIGQTAKFKNTLLSFYIGEFGWAKAQSDILKAATDKLISNDALALSILITENQDPDSGSVALSLYSQAGMLAYRNQDSMAIRLLDSIPLLFGYQPILDEVLLKKAILYEKTGHYLTADSLLASITAGYPDEVLADRALFARARLRENHLNDPETALNLYLELISSYPGSVYVVDSRKRIRALRGN